MPTVNIYFLKQANIKDLQNLTSSLKTFVAEKLTCGDIKVWLKLCELGHSWEK